MVQNNGDHIGSWKKVSEVFDDNNGNDWHLFFPRYMFCSFQRDIRTFAATKKTLICVTVDYC